MGVLVTRSLLFGFYIRAVDFWKLPFGNLDPEASVEGCGWGRQDAEPPGPEFQIQWIDPKPESQKAWIGNIFLPGYCRRRSSLQMP